jgi:hypothetical protein
MTYEQVFYIKYQFFHDTKTSNDLMVTVQVESTTCETLLNTFLQCNDLENHMRYALDWDKTEWWEMHMVILLTLVWLKNRHMRGL